MSLQHCQDSSQMIIIIIIIIIQIIGFVSHQALIIKS